MSWLSLGNAAARLSLVLSDLNSGLDAAALHYTCRGSYAYGAKKYQFFLSDFTQKNRVSKCHFNQNFNHKLKANYRLILGTI